SGTAEPQPAAAPLTVDQTLEIDAGNVVAVLIESTVLGVPIWFALVDGWTPDQDDLTPVFYASELAALRTKTPEQLKSILLVKTTFGGGKVHQ
ncbi:MAG: hypothetical protein ACREO5_00825, partial [Candidatus Binatia bacterium]